MVTALLAVIAILLVLILAAVTGTLSDVLFLGWMLLKGAFYLACVAGTVALIWAAGL